MHDTCNNVHSTEILSLLLRHGSRACTIRNGSNKLPVHLLLGDHSWISPQDQACVLLLVEHGGLPPSDAERWKGPNWRWLEDALLARSRARNAAILLLAFRRL